MSDADSQRPALPHGLQPPRSQTTEPTSCFLTPPNGNKVPTLNGCQDLQEVTGEKELEDRTLSLTVDFLPLLLPLLGAQYLTTRWQASMGHDEGQPPHPGHEGTWGTRQILCLFPYSSGSSRGAQWRNITTSDINNHQEQTHRLMGYTHTDGQGGIRGDMMMPGPRGTASSNDSILQERLSTSGPLFPSPTTQCITSDTSLHF